MILSELLSVFHQSYSLSRSISLPCSIASLYTYCNIGRISNLTFDGCGQCAPATSILRDQQPTQCQCVVFTQFRLNRVCSITKRECSVMLFMLFCLPPHSVGNSSVPLASPEPVEWTLQRRSSRPLETQPFPRKVDKDTRSV